MRLYLSDINSKLDSINNELSQHQINSFSIFMHRSRVVTHFCHRVNLPNKKCYVYDLYNSDFERKWFSDHFLRSLRSYEVERVVLVNHIAHKIITCSPAFLEAFRCNYPGWTYHIVQENEFILKAWEELIEYCKIL